MTKKQKPTTSSDNPTRKDKSRPHKVLVKLERFYVLEKYGQSGTNILLQEGHGAVAITEKAFPCTTIECHKNDEMGRSIYGDYYITTCLFV